MSELERLVSEARQQALAPEQALLRMLSRRRASPSALTVAHQCYTRAAAIMAEALALIDNRSGDPQE